MAFVSFQIYSNVATFLVQRSEVTAVLIRIIHQWLIPVAERSNAWVCSRSPAGIASSNPAGGMDVCLF